MKKAAIVRATKQEPVPSPGRTLIEGQVTTILRDGRVLLRRRRGAPVVCRWPKTNVDLGWLRAALAVGPVDAEGTFDAEQAAGSIWAVFPGPEHETVAAERVELKAASEISFRCGKASVALTKDGAVEVRGRDVLTRGSRSARLFGGVVRIN
jgi:hypothetical protein